MEEQNQANTLATLQMGEGRGDPSSLYKSIRCIDDKTRASRRGLDLASGPPPLRQRSNHVRSEPTALSPAPKIITGSSVLSSQPQN